MAAFTPAITSSNRFEVLRLKRSISIFLIISNLLAHNRAFISVALRHVESIVRPRRDNIVKSLTKREVENLSAGIQELDLKCVVLDWEALPPNDLIHAGLANFAVAVRPRVNSAVVAGSATVERKLEPNRLAVLRRSQNDVQVAGVEAEHNLAGHSLQHRRFRADVPRANESPLVQRGRRRRSVGPARVARHFFGRREILGLPVADVSLWSSLVVARRSLRPGARDRKSV